MKAEAAVLSSLSLIVRTAFADVIFFNIALRPQFNIVPQTGKIPRAWSIGYISPIYKGKGEENDPDNYRGITVLSCFGKLFTSVINDRIHSFF